MNNEIYVKIKKLIEEIEDEEEKNILLLYLTATQEIFSSLPNQ